MTVKEAKAIAKDHERLANNLISLRKQFGRIQMANFANMTMQTWTNKVKNPGKFTYDELMSVARLTGVDAADLIFGILELKGR